MQTTTIHPEPHPKQPSTANFEIVLDVDFPDPSVMKASDGRFYAYATQRFTKNGVINVQVARSDDLFGWEFVGDAMPDKPVWTNITQDFWAPFVIEADGKFIMYFSALPNTREGMAIGVAVADNPLGPFKDVGQPLVGGHGFVTIDPFAFTDPKTGKKLLFWGSGFEAIKARELNDDWMGFKPDTPVVEVLHPSDAPYEKLLEGAFIRYCPLEDYFFLFTSGDNCFGGYAVMIARSREALGPYKKLSEVIEHPDSVILKGKDHFVDPGNNSIITDKDGQDWLFCHVILQDSRHDPETGAIRRPMARIKIDYDDGWPHIEGWSTHHLSRPKDCPIPN